MFSHLVISIDELWLKGKNRKDYLRSAVDHVAAVFKVYHPDKFTFKIQSERLYYSSKTLFSEELIKALTCVPGLAYISPCKMLERLPDENLENVYEEIVNGLSIMDKKSIVFRAMVKRVDKNFSQTSVFIGREIGHRVITRYPLAKVDLKHAELVIDVRILPKHISISTETRKGMGGLPWGSTGSAVTMLSGGFDSPVASFLMAKRGVKQSFVFFHAYPFVGREVVTKIKNLTKELAKFQRQTHLYIVPFGDIQNLISKQCREEYRTLVFRRYMIEISNLICDKVKADSVITGDCIGQVSSQTMHNLHLMDLVSKRMILRPLVGYNKLEILNTATAIGTHDISIIPHDDACSLFASKNPIINPNMEYWQNWDKDFDISAELAAALEKTEVFSINLQGEFYKKEYFSFDA
ncbi:MAG: tRNA 4-thiouridine(8) synthase ThiI [Rhizobacter sp.]|nr:tRNA 4-thiouridine(8) synthase ThiI [Bacteriovorax sp.]